MFPPVDLNSTKKCFIRTHLARIDTSFKQSELIRNCVNFQDIVLWPIKMFEYQISYSKYLPHLVQIGINASQNHFKTQLAIWALAASFAN